MHAIRQGQGRPLLLVHGLGSSSRTWLPTAIPYFRERRAVVAPDLPGHGESPAGPDSQTFAGLAESLASFIEQERMVGTDMVGTSMGGRLVLEMARRGLAGAVVALDPGGFWQGWERTWFKATLKASVGLLRTLGPLRGALARSAPGRTALLAQLSARPWSLDGSDVARELSEFAETRTVPALIGDLARGPAQTGPAHPVTGKVVIGWGRHDRLCLPVQARRAMAAFPSAELHWFEHSGHFPLWDEPSETLALISRTIGG